MMMNEKNTRTVDIKEERQEMQENAKVRSEACPSFY